VDPASRPTAVDDAARIPERLVGPFVLVEPLGRGATSEVWKAWDNRLARWVALKLLRSGAPDDVERFNREALAVARLSHPGIASLLEAGQAGDRLFIAIQFVDGHTLDRAKLPLRAAVEAVRDAARAVSFAHQNGILHRDLKPGNIMIDRDGRTVVLDFGLASISRTPSAASVSGTVVGTPGYMSPEQALGRLRMLDARTDVYGLGATLYALACGGPPFHGSTAAEILMRVVSDEPVPPRRARPDLPAEIEIIIQRAMERERHRRYATAAELAADLDRYLRGEPILAHRPTLAYRLRKSVWRHRVLAAATLAAVATAILATVVTVHVMDRPVPPPPAPDPERAKLENFRRMQERLKPIEDVVREARPLFYAPTADIRSTLDRVERALADLDAIVADPSLADFPDPWVTLGIGWSVAGDADRALAALERAITLAPDHATAHLHLGRLCLERSIVARMGPFGNTPRAAESGRSWARRAADHFRRSDGGATELERHVALTARALADDNPNEVARLCHEGTTRWPSSVGSEEYWNLGGVLVRGAAREKAFTVALQLRPHWPWAFFMRGMAREEQGRHRDALADYDRAVAIYPRYVDALCNRAAVRRDLDDADGAIADLNLAIRLRPSFAVAWHNRSQAWYVKGDFARALADVDEAIRLEPIPQSHVLRGHLRQRDGNAAGAIADFETALPFIEPGSKLRADVERWLKELRK
jgi:tetratricopeptide (TPR) repeat protein/predicted Ser/Thr protein kinase